MLENLFKAIQENMQTLFGAGASMNLLQLYKDKPTNEELKEICEIIDLFETVRGALNSNYLELIDKLKDKNLFYDTKTRELHKFTFSDEVILLLPKLV